MISTPDLSEQLNTITQKYFKVNNEVDFHRFDFADSPIKCLRECSKEVKLFSSNFSKSDTTSSINSKTLEILFAIERAIQCRPFQEQFPEVWDPLIRANLTLDRLTNSTSNIEGWQAHYDKSLETVFSKVSLDYLQKQNPSFTYVDVFEFYDQKKNWIEPIFELDGLLYCENTNTFFIVESKFFLSSGELQKTKATISKFSTWLCSAKPERRRDTMANYRKWMVFFEGDDRVVKGGRREDATVELFLGFHTCTEEGVLHLATKTEGFHLIGPEDGYYAVLE